MVCGSAGFRKYNAEGWEKVTGAYSSLRSEHGLGASM
jgi:hypothetical protein